MGACYSKNTSGTGTSSESKRPNHKHKDQSRSGKGNAEDLKQNDKHLEKPALMNDTSNDAESRLSIVDAVAGHVNEKLVNSGVVPSDSGIESINTVTDDVGESAQLKQTDKTPEHPSCGSRHWSGDHDVILDSRQNEGHMINSHDTQNSKDSPTTCSKIYAEHEETSAKNGTITTINALTNGSHGDINDFKCKQNLRSMDSSNKVGSTCLVSECTVTKSDIIHTSMPSLKGYTNTQSNTSSETSTSYKAPLAAFDSIEGNLNESSIHFNGKRQSLLSEILDLTESLCKCDFYSTENCSRDHGINGAVTGLRHNGHNSEVGASGQFEKVSERLNQILPYKCKPLSGSSSASASQMSSTPSKKLPSLPKNVSFAAHEHSTEGASGASHNNHLDSDLFILSSDKYSHRTASEIIFPNKQKDLHKRSASLGSVKATMSDSSSDVPDGTTEDDIASLDLDNISRVTSISYNSIRQLVESTENLVSARYIAQSLTIDGVDCVAIPKDIYRQMQTDLATLRQQLVYLSSLMQEGAVDIQDE